MSKIIAPVPKDVVVDSRRNIVGAGLVVFFGEQGDDPIETAEDIYAKVDGIETSIGKFVEIKENGQFYYDDNPVSIFIQGSINKYVSCGLYQKIGNKLSQIDYIASLAAFTAAQEQALDLVQNIRAKAGYKRHFQTMKEAKEYQGYYLNQVVFISEVNDDPQLAGQFIIKSSDDNIVDSITSFSIANSSYVLQRITGAYPYKNTLQVTAKSIDDIHKFMYHLKMAGNFKCTLVVDYDFTTENIDLTIFKKVIFNNTIKLLKGLNAREVIIRKVYYCGNGIFSNSFSRENKYNYYIRKSTGYNIELVKPGYREYREKISGFSSLIINCKIAKLYLNDFNNIGIYYSEIGSLIGDNKINIENVLPDYFHGARRQGKLFPGQYVQPYGSLSFIVVGCSINFQESKIQYGFFWISGSRKLFARTEYQPFGFGSYIISNSKVSFYKCNLSPLVYKNGYIYELPRERGVGDGLTGFTSIVHFTVLADNPSFEGSTVSITESSIQPCFGYISDNSIANSAIQTYGSKIYTKNCNTIRTGIKMRNRGVSGNMYNGIVFYNSKCNPLFIYSNNIASESSIYNGVDMDFPNAINGNYALQLSIVGGKIPYQEMPIWENAIRQNSTNVIEGTALPGFLSVGEHPNDGEVTYTPVPT